MTVNVGNLELSLAQKTSGKVPASVTKGEHTYTTPGTYLFTVPNGITSISVLAVGGGGSGGKGTNAAGGGAVAYLNNKTVIPGQSYTIIVGAGGAATTGAGTRDQAGNDGGDSSAFGITAGGGKGGQQGTPAYGTDGVFGGGGLGGEPSGTYTAGYTGGRGGGHSGIGDNAGGGSSAGYSADGKNGAGAYYLYSGITGAGGSGGSGAGTASNTYDNGGSGGGVGIYGEGSNGSGGTSNSTLEAAHGGAGSNGSGVTYGGGTGSSYTSNSLKGGDGAVRIIYGTGRSWPATLTSLAESGGNVVTNGVSSSSSLASATTGLDLLTAHKILGQLKTGEVHNVDTFANLPTASENLGKLYYVADEDIIYWANSLLGWVNLNTTEAKNIYGVGEDYYGQLGTGAWGNSGGGDKYYPTILCVLGGDSNDWVYLNNGKCHSVGMKAAGSLHFWGNGPNGRGVQSSLQAYADCAHFVCCGSDQCYYTYVCGVAGNCRTVGLTTNGTIFTWGYIGFGSGGNNTGSNNHNSGTQEITSSTNWCHVATGWYAGSHGIKTDGTFWSWGADNYGLMGRNTCNINASSPVQEITSSTNWCTGDYGFYSNGGIKTDGTMWGWGTGFYGVSFTAGVPSSSPVRELLSATNWCKMAYTGGNQPYSGIALKTDGTMWNWGCNGNGTLGIGTTTNTSTPTQEITSSTTWCGIAAGSESGRGIKTDGTIWAWGKQFTGEFSQSCTYSACSYKCYCSPVQEQTSATDWCMVSAGGDYNNGFTQMIKSLSL